MKFKETAMRLRNALDNAQLSPQELANRTGISKSSISQYLNGKNRPSSISAGAMGKELKVSPLWLMGYDVNINQGIVNNVGNNNGSITNTVGDITGKDQSTDKSVNNSTVNDYYATPKPSCEVSKPLNTNITLKSKEYFFTLIDNVRDMTDEQLLDMIKYAEFILKR